MTSALSRASAAAKSAVGFGSNTASSATRSTAENDFTTIQNNVLKLEDVIDAIRKNIQHYVTSHKQIWKYSLDFSTEFYNLYAADTTHRLTSLCNRYENIHSNIATAKVELL